MWGYCLTCGTAKRRRAGPVESCSACRLLQVREDALGQDEYQGRDVENGSEEQGHYDNSVRAWEDAPAALEGRM